MASKSNESKFFEYVKSNAYNLDGINAENAHESTKLSYQQINDIINSQLKFIKTSFISVNGENSQQTNFLNKTQTGKKMIETRGKEDKIIKLINDCIKLEPDKIEEKMKVFASILSEYENLFKTSNYYRQYSLVSIGNDKTSEKVFSAYSKFIDKFTNEVFNKKFLDYLTSAKKNKDNEVTKKFIDNKVVPFIYNSIISKFAFNDDAKLTKNDLNLIKWISENKSSKSLYFNKNITDINNQSQISDFINEAKLRAKKENFIDILEKSAEDVKQDDYLRYAKSSSKTKKTKFAFNRKTTIGMAIGSVAMLATLFVSGAVYSFNTLPVENATVFNAIKDAFLMSSTGYSLGALTIGGIVGGTPAAISEFKTNKFYKKLNVVKNIKDKENFLNDLRSLDQKALRANKKGLKRIKGSDNDQLALFVKKYSDILNELISEKGTNKFYRRTTYMGVINSLLSNINYIDEKGVSPKADKKKKKFINLKSIFIQDKGNISIDSIPLETYGTNLFIPIVEKYGIMPEVKCASLMEYKKLEAHASSKSLLTSEQEELIVADEELSKVRSSIEDQKLTSDLSFNLLEGKIIARIDIDQTKTKNGIKLTDNQVKKVITTLLKAVNGRGQVGKTIQIGTKAKLIIEEKDPNKETSHSK